MAYISFRNPNQELYAFLMGLDKGNGGGAKIVNATSTLRDRTPIPQPEQLDEAEAKWGKASSFSWGRDSQDFREGVVPSTTWTFDENPEGPQEPAPEDQEELEPLTDEWTEVERKETELRINGPDGAYVDFKRIDEVKFKLPNLPDGREHFVVMKFKTAGDGITPGPPGAGSGGSGASGAVGVGSDGLIRDPNGPGTL